MSRKDADDRTTGEEQSKPSRAGLPVDVHRVVRAVRGGKWWIAVAGVLGSMIGVLVGKLALQHTYEATASIRYEGLPGQAIHEVQADVPSLVSITHSESTMRALRARMDMDRASIDAMRRLVRVEADNGSGLVSFTASANGPERAATMANALVEIFLDHHRERRRGELDREIDSLQQRIRAAEGELAEARRIYDQFREVNQITDLSAEQEQAITQAAELRSETDLAEAEMQALEARVRQLRAALARTPRMEAVSSGASAGAQRLRELRARLAEMRSTLSDEHPQVQAMRRQVEALQRGGGGSSTTTRMAVSSLYEQTQSNLAEAETELEAARRRHEALDRNAAHAQDRTNRFSSIEGQAATLLAQVNVKEALVTELRQAKARAEDQLRDVETGFRTVSRAQAPESAVPSKKKYLAAAGIPLLFVTGMLALLLYRELRGLFVQTPAEVAWWGNGPVIGTTTWPRDPRALIDLIADMDDFAPEAKGTMLIVGAAEGDRDLASEIAAQLNHDWQATTMFDAPVAGALPPPRLEAPTHYDDDDDGEDDPTHVYDVFELDEGDGGGSALALATPVFDLELLGSSDLAGYAPSPRDLEDMTDRLICTAWTGGSEGPALRRAARLADRVLVIVTSNAVRATALAQMKRRLGRGEAVGFVLVGAADDVARLPDRAGNIEEFWDGGVAK